MLLPYMVSYGNKRELFEAQQADPMIKLVCFLSFDFPSDVEVAPQTTMKSALVYIVTFFSIND